MKPEPIDLQNIGKVYHNENEAVCNEENYEDETKEENLCCRQVKRGGFILLIIIMIMEY